MGTASTNRKKTNLMTDTTHSISRLRVLVLGVTAMLLAGCATFSEDGGFSAVETTARERLGQETHWVRSKADEDAVRSRLKDLLAKPITADDAVQIALINNRGLQATYAELGLAEADLVQAGRLSNPLFSYSHVKGGGELDIERILLFNIFDVVTIPARTRLGEQRFEQTKLSVSAQMLNLALETRRAFYGALAARERTRYFEQVKESAEASAELARRMYAAGNFSALQRAREQAFYAEAVAQLARAKQMALAERERLTRLMGLWGEDIRFQLPERLPDLPAEPMELEDVERSAMKTRLDVQASQRELGVLAENLGLARTTRFINALELGPKQVRDKEVTLNGYEVEVQIPLFDWGSARVARAESHYMQAANRLAQVAVDARSEVREAYAGYHSTYALAKHYRDEIVPLRKRISEENVLRYSGMLIGVFELLADAREQVASVNASIEALRDFWLADVNLLAARNGAAFGTSGTTAPSMALGGAGGH